MPSSINVITHRPKCFCVSVLQQLAIIGPVLALGRVMSAEAPKSVLIVEDEQSIRDILVELFDIEGNAVSSAELLPEALEKLRSQRFDLIVTDLRLGGKRDGGLQVMALAGMLSPDAMVLVLTAYPDDSNRQASFRLGALHFLEKPVDLATIAQHAAAVGVRTAFATSAR
jgi:CheY-like chemotaxis protein